MLPEMDGFALCRIIRKESNLPIILLAARGEMMDRVVGMTGARLNTELLPETPDVQPGREALLRDLAL